jgi:hypothetical protein
MLCSSTLFIFLNKNCKKIKKKIKNAIPVTLGEDQTLLLGYKVLGTNQIPLPRYGCRNDERTML